MTGPILSALRQQRQSAALLATLLVLPAQGPVPRYTPSALACAAYSESVTSDIRSQSGSVLRQERSGRDGTLFVRATAAAQGLSIEAWYDTLTVWREGPEGRVVPDASGLFGGRYRGRLTGDGSFTVAETPFVPDEVMEIADLSTELSDFFPPAPDHPLGPGERHTWTRRTSADTTALQQDTLAVPVARQVEETGWVLWDAVKGPVEWERMLTLTFRIEAKGGVKRGVRSTVRQRIRVTRRPGAEGCPP